MCRVNPRAAVSSEAKTHGIHVRVQSEYRPERSNPRQRQYFFAYTVNITNEGSQPVQLISRHWVITDAHGHVEEVRGPGVVGEQPIIKPGAQYQYSSACPLNTEFGTMHGSYQMRAADGSQFDAAIAPFRLALPQAIH